MNDPQALDTEQQALRLLCVLHAWYRDSNHSTGSNLHRDDELYPGNQRKRDTGYYGNVDPLWQQVETLIRPK